MDRSRKDKDRHDDEPAAKTAPLPEEAPALSRPPVPADRGEPAPRDGPNGTGDHHVEVVDTDEVERFPDLAPIEADAGLAAVSTRKPPSSDELMFPNEAEVEDVVLEDADVVEAGSALTSDPGAATGKPVALTDQETRTLLRSLKKQQKQRLEQDLEEARRLEAEAKQLTKKAKEAQKRRAELAKHEEHVAQLAPQLGFDPERPITVVPEVDADHLTEVEFITIQEGRSYVRVLFDKRVNSYLYETIEPQLMKTEEEILDFLRDTLARTLDGRQAGQDRDAYEAYLSDAVEQAILDHSILVDEVSKQRLQYYILRDFLGYGPIDVLMRDPMIEDISCDGPDVPIYLFHRQYESIKTNIRWDSEWQLDSFVIRLAQRSGKHISIANPLLDATLPDKSRLQATLSREVTTRGSSFTIRKFRSDPLTPPDLVRLGTFNARMAGFYWMLMEHGASHVQAGGTASGKTTTLNAICQFIPPAKKVVSIEDTREINLAHENWIAGLTRSGFAGGLIAGKEAGTVDMFKLLEAALRQRPEYLLVGEVRGQEALTLFQAMATGHATYSTLHADSVMSAVYRLENPPINVPRIMLQTLDCVSVQVQARMNQRMVRRIKEVVEIVGIDPDSGDLLTNTVFEWDPATDQHTFRGKSHVLEQIMDKNNMTLAEIQEDWDNRTRVVAWMVDKGIRRLEDVANVIASYYAHPDRLLEEIERHGRQGRADGVDEADGPNDAVLTPVDQVDDAEIEEVELDEEV